MDVNNERTAQSAAAPEDLAHQHLKERRHSNSPVGIVYDCERKTVDVWSMKKIRQSSLSHLRVTVNKKPESANIYQEVKLPTRKKHVTLFLDKETRSKFTTQSTGDEGQSNFLRAQLQLDRLNVLGQVYRILGLLETLYVINAGSLSETSSLT